MAKLKNIESVPHKDCTGCYGCVNVCPHNAISMRDDEHGFIHPSVDAGKCTGCGLCYDKCPIVSPRPILDYDAKAYSVAASNEICLQSTSGGAFTVLAEHILQLDGVVFGARSNGLEQVWHDVATNRNELEPLRGSKYFQSEVGWTYRKIKEYLKKGKKVLFVGTPCQVAGLRNFLGKDNANLFVCDLVCHGVPSKMIFRRFIKEFENKYHTQWVRYYRNRQLWAPCLFTKEFCVKPIGLDVAYDEEKNVWRENKFYDVDEFNQLFHSNLIQRDSCRHCRFCHIPRVGDITLGDDWRYYNEHIGEPEKLQYGRSYIIINNPQGRQLFEQVKHSFIDCVEREYVGGGHINTPPKANPLTGMFYRDAKQKNILDLIWGYTIRPTLKVRAVLYMVKMHNKLYQISHRAFHWVKRVVKKD